MKKEKTFKECKLIVLGTATLYVCFSTLSLKKWHTAPRNCSKPLRWRLCCKERGEQR